MQVYGITGFGNTKYQKEKVCAGRPGYMSIPKNNIGDTVTFGNAQSEIVSQLTEFAKSIQVNKKIHPEAKELFLEIIELLESKGEKFLTARKGRHIIQLEFLPSTISKETSATTPAALLSNKSAVTGRGYYDYYLEIDEKGIISNYHKLAKSDGEITQWISNATEDLKFILPNEITPLEEFLSKLAKLSNKKNSFQTETNGWKLNFTKRHGDWFELTCNKGNDTINIVYSAASESIHEISTSTEPDKSNINILEDYGEMLREASTEGSPFKDFINVIKETSAPLLAK